MFLVGLFGRHCGRVTVPDNSDRDVVVVLGGSNRDDYLDWLVVLGAVVPYYPYSLAVFLNSGNNNSDTQIEFPAGYEHPRIADPNNF